MIQATTLTFSYNQREDRIFFIINHNNPMQRVDFIITRRKLLDLLNGFDTILINHCDNGKLFKQLYHAQEPLKKENNKKQEQQESQNKNNWEKAVDTNELQLTKIKEPIILDTLTYSLVNGLFQFKFYNQNELKVVTNLSSESFQKTLSSLMRVIPFVHWGISPHILD